MLYSSFKQKCVYWNRITAANRPNTNRSTNCECSKHNYSLWKSWKHFSWRLSRHFLHPFIVFFLQSAQRPCLTLSMKCPPAIEKYTEIDGWSKCGVLSYDTWILIIHWYKPTVYNIINFHKFQTFTNWKWRNDDTGVIIFNLF